MTLPEPITFDWDKHNKNKILQKHGLSTSEIEQAFFNRRVYWFDEVHSTLEQRYTLLGVTDLDKILYIIFTIRINKIKVISARPADKKERENYEKEAKENPQI